MMNSLSKVYFRCLVITYMLKLCLRITEVTFIFNDMMIVFLKQIPYLFKFKSHIPHPAIFS